MPLDLLTRCRARVSRIRVTPSPLARARPALRLPSVGPPPEPTFARAKQGVTPPPSPSSIDPGGGAEPPQVGSTSVLPTYPTYCARRQGLGLPPPPSLGPSRTRARERPQNRPHPCQRLGCPPLPARARPILKAQRPLGDSTGGLPSRLPGTQRQGLGSPPPPSAG